MAKGQSPAFGVLPALMEVKWLVCSKKKASWIEEEIKSSTEFHLVKTSCLSGCFGGSWCSSSSLAGLCLNWLTLLGPFANAPPNPPSAKRRWWFGDGGRRLAAEHRGSRTLQPSCGDLLPTCRREKLQRIHFRLLPGIITLLNLVRNRLSGRQVKSWITFPSPMSTHGPEASSSMDFGLPDPLVRTPDWGLQRYRLRWLLRSPRHALLLNGTVELKRFDGIQTKWTGKSCTDKCSALFECKRRLNAWAFL